MHYPVNFQETYLYKLRTLSGLLERLFDRTLRVQAGITLSQFMVLMAVGQRETINQRQIAQYLGLSAVAVKRQVDLAKRAAWIQTSDHPSRGEALHLTDSGNNILQKSLQILEQHLFQIFDSHNRNATLMQHLDLLLGSTKTILEKPKQGFRR